MPSYNKLLLMMLLPTVFFSCQKNINTVKDIEGTYSLEKVTISKYPNRQCNSGESLMEFEYTETEIYFEFTSEFVDEENEIYAGKTNFDRLSRDFTLPNNQFGYKLTPSENSISYYIATDYLGNKAIVIDGIDYIQLVFPISEIKNKKIILKTGDKDGYNSCYSDSITYELKMN